MIAHFDLDCFFVAVERLHTPELIGKPVAVGGSATGRGVIASASYEARKFGVRSAMATATALRLCPQLIVVPGRHGTYAGHSRNFQKILTDYSPLVEMASVDEAYVDFAGTENLFGPSPDVAWTIVTRVREELHLDVSVALSTSRMVAKIGSDLCKPQGFLVVPPGTEAEFLAPLAIEKMPGVGPRTAEVMRAAGIRTFADLANLPPESRWAEWVPYAKGEVIGGVYPEEGRKSLSVETTFAQDLHAGEDLWHQLREVAEEAGRRLRREGLRARTVSVKLKFADFTSQTAARTLAEATDIDREIYQTALELAEARVGRQRLRLIGVGLSNLVEEDTPAGQLDLFASKSAAERKRWRGLDQTLDRLRTRYGSDAVHWGYRTPNDKKEEDAEGES
jgi:DNA polymerase IV